MKYLIADAASGAILRTGNTSDPIAAYRQARAAEVVYTHTDIGLVDDARLEVRAGALARKDGVLEPVQGEGLPLLQITLV